MGILFLILLIIGLIMLFIAMDCNKSTKFFVTSIVLTLGSLIFIIFSGIAIDLADKYDDKIQSEILAYDIKLEQTDGKWANVSYTNPETKGIEFFKTINLENNTLIDSKEEKIIEIKTKGPWSNFVKLCWGSENTTYEIHLDRSK